MSNLIAHKSIKVSAPASEVWDALTNPELIKKYFFGTEAISDWKEGSQLLFTGEWNGTKYEDKGTILKSLPNRQFRYNYWSSMSGTEDIPENYATITYELQEQANETLLTISQDGIADEARKKETESNWEQILKSLKELVEKEVQLK